MTTFVPGRPKRAALLCAPFGRLLGAWDRIAPRRQDVLPALAAGLIGLLPLLGIRMAITAERFPAWKIRDAWRAHDQEVETWALVALVAAFLLRPLRGGWHRAGRVGIHAAATLLMAATGLELGYLYVTGSRLDLEVLDYFLSSAAEVLPVVLDEVRTGYAAALGTGIVLGMLPILPRIRPSPSRTWGRLVLFLLVATLLVHVLMPTRSARRELREMSDALVPLLVEEALDRAADATLPPEQPETPLALSPPTRQPLPNIVLVMLESMGLYRTSFFDPSLDTTPNLVDLASRGLEVEEAWAVVPHTSKSLVTMLCSQYPELVQEVREAHANGLPGPCMAEILGGIGYRTAFFQTAKESFENRVALAHEMRFDLFRGMSHFQRPPYEEKLNPLGIADEAMLDPGVAWSMAEPGPFFATYVTVSTHNDYDVPPWFETRAYPGVENRKLRRYLNAVRYIDDFAGRLVRAYEARGLGDDTLFVLLGDHGEGFGEHGRYFHDLTIYEEGLRIPMVLYGPGVLGDRSGVIRGPRQTLDVLPTVLEILGIEVTNGRLEGTSLLGEAPEDRTLFHSCWRSWRCLASRTGGRKFIDHFRQQKPQVFDIHQDPAERHDLAGTLPASEIRRLRKEVRGWRALVNGRAAARREAFLADGWIRDDRPAQATWGGILDMVSCTLEKEDLEPADAAWIRCRWRTREGARALWKRRVVLSGAFEEVERVEAPLDGRLSTHAWQPGLARDDLFRVHVPADASPGEAAVSVGWQTLTGRAVPLDTGGETVEIGRIRIGPPTLMVPPPLPDGRGPTHGTP
ncbi:MAG: LTA synthase family protein [Deltaproteobacteria bacterium]|nr:LTA synthase family protein [Deltaproteobacteria bacterium]